MIIKLKKHLEKIGSLIEVKCKKKLVFARALLPVGTVGGANPQTAHLQIAQAKAKPKFAKELFLSTAQISSMFIFYKAAI